jgi:DNA adenine methylase
MTAAKPIRAKPFLKWAGGKTQLLDEFARRLPRELESGACTRYVEPFLGGGAVFFAFAGCYRPRESFLFDINGELVLAYRAVQKDPDLLIEELRGLADRYLPLPGEGRRSMYYEVREMFNRERPAVNFSRYSRRWVRRAAMLIFLNRTCYNGLFRVNSRGEFNVPHGRYQKPRILDEANIRAASGLLCGATVRRGDFSACRRFVDERTFVYIDPPYRPLSRTAAFTAYAKGGFDDADQSRLAAFCREIDERGALFMVSNSDPKNADPSDTFFDDLYAGFTIERVPARRMINCCGERRGSVSELIITNYRARA